MNIEFQERHDRKGVIKLKVTFENSDINLTETLFGTILHIEGCGIKGEIGGPGLPSQVIKIALPPLTTNVNVSTEHGNKASLNHAGDLIAPIQLCMINAKNNNSPPEYNGGPIKENERFKPLNHRVRDQLFVEPYPSPPMIPPDPRLYELAIEQPQPPVRLIETTQIGMTSIALLEINPVRLLENGIIEFYPEISITLEYRSLDLESVLEKDQTRHETLSDSAITSRCQASRAVELARAVVVNPEAVFDYSKFFPDLITNIEYLVITDNFRWNKDKIRRIGELGPAIVGPFRLPADLETEPVSLGDIVGAFQRLVEWKKKRGLRAQVVTVSDIVSGVYGNFVKNSRDLQEVIRNFLKWAYRRWGVSWVLLGGDTGIVPVRVVAGGSDVRDGRIDLQNTDPPSDNNSFWTGDFLKMKLGADSKAPGVGWPGASSSMPLVRFDTGLLIPYDKTGSSGPSSIGWYFTDEIYKTRSTVPTLYIRVNGQESAIKGRMQWLYQYNTLPTDLYYSSIVGSNYDVDGKHDWDLLDNGIYGQHAREKEFDGVSYRADISVGRAPVSNADEANAFVNKVIAYEKFSGPDGKLLDLAWPTRMLFVSDNLYPRLQINPMPHIEPLPTEPIASAPRPDVYRYYQYEDSTPYSLIRLKSDTDFVSDFYKFRPWLFAIISDTDIRTIPYRSNPTSSRGWNFVRSSSDLSVSELKVRGYDKAFPIPTNWVAVYGPKEELSPLYYIFDLIGQDFSMIEQEDLRNQLAAEFPNINNISRLYLDEVDLSAAELAAAPIEHLTIDRLRDSLNYGQHFVSLSGHGNPDGCCGLSVNMVKNLTNGYHSFIGYADSCLTNAFDFNDAVSEYSVCNPNGGAVGYVGYTRFGIIGAGDDFQRAFFHRLTSTKHLGLLNDIRCTMVHGPSGEGANKWTIFAQNLVGDPEMPVWGGSPRILKVAFPRVLDRRKMFSIKIDQQFLANDHAVEDIAVHIQQQNFSRLVHMDSNGLATFDISMAQLGKLDITVTLDGLIPCIDSARVTGPYWVSGIVTQIIHQPKVSQQSWIKLQLDQTIEQNSYRYWSVQHAMNDYTTILDAATDAYVSGKTISLFVDNLDEGGNIEGFRFGVADSVS